MKENAEILVMDVGLSGEPGINSPLAFRMEAQATFIRVRDDQIICSCPLHYRSLEKKFGDCAAPDAEAFRLELERCHYQMSGAIAEQLTGAGLVRPSRAPNATVARN